MTRHTLKMTLTAMAAALLLAPASGFAQSAPAAEVEVEQLQREMRRMQADLAELTADLAEARARVEAAQAGRDAAPATDVGDDADALRASGVATEPDAISDRLGRIVETQARIERRLDALAEAVAADAAGADDETRPTAGDQPDADAPAVRIDRAERVELYPPFDYRYSGAGQQQQDASRHTRSGQPSQGSTTHSYTRYTPRYGSATPISRIDATPDVGPLVYTDRVSRTYRYGYYPYHYDHYRVYRPYVVRPHVGWYGYHHRVYRPGRVSLGVVDGRFFFGIHAGSLRFSSGRYYR